MADKAKGKNPGSISMESLLPKAMARDFAELYWEGSFEDYLEIVREHPEVTRNAFQRIYDMITSKGVEEYIDNKKKIIKGLKYENRNKIQITLFLNTFSSIHYFIFNTYISFSTSFLS